MTWSPIRIALAVALLGAGVTLFSGAAGAQPSSADQCQAGPRQNAQDWQDDYPTGGIRCTPKCREWVQTCRRISNEARKCRQQAIDAEFTDERGSCDTESDKRERAECRRQAQRNKASRQQVNSSDRRLADSADCEDMAEDCLDTCQNGGSG